MKKLQKLLRIWLIGAGVVFLILLIQTFAAFSDVSNILFVWLWWAIVFLPVMVLLWRFKSKAATIDINPFTYRLLLIISRLYILLAVGLLMARPFFDQWDPVHYMYQAGIGIFVLNIFIFGVMFVYLRNPGKPSIIAPFLGATLQVPGDKASVFISYADEDIAIAERIASTLKGADIFVVIDKEQLRAGQNKADFVKEAVKLTNYTLSIVSEHSLKSTWVALKNDLSLQFENFSEKDQFITCALDRKFKEAGYITDCIREINERIEQKQEEQKERLALNSLLSTEDLDTEINALKRLIKSLPTLITRLQTHFTVFIDEQQADLGLEQVIERVKETKSPTEA